MVERKKRLLFLLNHLHKGGMQRAVSNITISLNSYYDLHVGFFGSEAPDFEYYATMHNFDVPGEQNMGPILKIWNLARRAIILRNFVKSNEIDFVISFGEGANILNLISKHKAKTIISVRVALEESLRGLGSYGRIYHHLTSLLYPRADTIVAVSGTIKEYLHKRFKHMSKRIVSIPNLVDAERLNRLANQKPYGSSFIAKNRRYILNVGSYCSQKGQDILIEAYAHLKDRLPGTDLVLLGRGQEQQLLLRKSEELGVLKNVHFVPFNSNPYRFMRRADIFVLSSRYEGFPNVLLEAMALGTPVVSFDCPTGPKEILGDSQYGVLVETTSSRALSEAIADLLQDNASQILYSRLARRRAQNYSPDAIASMWRRVIEHEAHLD